MLKYSLAALIAKTSSVAVKEARESSTRSGSQPSTANQPGDAYPFVTPILQAKYKGRGSCDDDEDDADFGWLAGKTSKKNCKDDSDNHGCHLLCKDVCEIDRDFTLTTPAAPTRTTTYAMLLPQEYRIFVDGKKNVITTPPATTDVICNFDVSWVDAATPPVTTLLFKDLESRTLDDQTIAYQFAINNLNGAYSSWAAVKVVKRCCTSYRRDCDWEAYGVDEGWADPLSWKGFLKFSMSAGNKNCP